MKITRTQYALMTLLTIFLGLLSRKLPFLPMGVGDMLWGIMIFFVFSFVFTEKTIGQIARISLLFCYLIEFSQLIQIPWLNEIRSSRLGHLVLGQGFLWTDLLAYTIGILLVWMFFHRFEISHSSMK